MTIEEAYKITKDGAAQDYIAAHGIPREDWAHYEVVFIRAIYQAEAEMAKIPPREALTQILTEQIIKDGYHLDADLLLIIGTVLEYWYQLFFNVEAARSYEAFMERGYPEPEAMEEATKALNPDSRRRAIGFIRSGVYNVIAQYWAAMIGNDTLHN